MPPTCHQGSYAILKEQTRQIAQGKTNTEELADLHQHRVNTCIFYKVVRTIFLHAR